MGFVELESLSAGVVDGGEGAGAEGDGGVDGGCEDWGGWEVAFVGWLGGGGGGGCGVAHLEGEAVVFVYEEVCASEGDVVGEGCGVAVDVVAVCCRVKRSGLVVSL